MLWKIIKTYLLVYSCERRYFCGLTVQLCTTQIPEVMKNFDGVRHKNMLKQYNTTFQHSLVFAGF